MHATRMDAVERPPAIGLPLGPHDLDGLGHPGIGVRARVAEVVEGAQHVVAPVVREREVEILRVDDFARALATEQVALEQVLLPAAAGLIHRRGPAGRALELEQAVEHVDRRVERGAHRAVLDLAVPAPVGEPLTEDPLDDRGDVQSEVGAGLDRPAVDARLDLAIEVPLTGVLPTSVLSDERHRAAGRVRCRVEPEDLQRLQGVHRCRPRLPRFATGVRRREARATVPQSVGTLERQEAGTPALVLHTRPLGGDLVGRGIREIAQHLPADRWIPFEQPIDHGHRSSLDVPGANGASRTPGRRQWVRRFRRIRTRTTAWRRCRRAILRPRSAIGARRARTSPSRRETPSRR